MFIVLSQISWFLIIFLQGIGICFLDRDEKPISLQDLSICLLFGLLIEYFFFLLNLPLQIQYLLVALIIFSNILGFVKLKPREMAFSIKRFDLIGLIVIGFPLLVRTLFYPADAWDTRSIWMFQAKMIFHGGGIEGLRELSNPAFSFSHASYPKLIQMLMAKSALVAGIWNEYLPKFGFWFLGLLSVTSILSVSPSRFKKVTLLLALIGVPHDLVWNGYADGLLVIFTIIGIIHLINWIRTEEKLSLISALLYLSLSANIKDEGKVLMALTLLSFSVFNFKKFKAHYKWSIVLLSGLLPILLWSYTKSNYNFHSWAGLNSDAFNRLSTRIFDIKILTHLFKDAWTHLCRPLTFCIIAVLSSTFYLKESSIFKKNLNIFTPILFITLGYICILWIVYLSTPYDPHWHISTSIKRTMIFPLLSLILFAVKFRER